MKRHDTEMHLRRRRFDELFWINAYIAEHGWAPTYREIKASAHVASISQVEADLRWLADHGYIVLGHGPRMIRIVGLPYDTSQR